MSVKAIPSSTITSKGQLTVPIEVRHRLGLREGDRVEFAQENGRTFIRPARPAGNPFQHYLGALPAFSSLDEINAWVRDLRSDDEAAE